LTSQSWLDCSDSSCNKGEQNTSGKHREKAATQTLPSRDGHSFPTPLYSSVKIKWLLHEEDTRGIGQQGVQHGCMAKGCGHQHSLSFPASL
jgi:hypothetical protein